EGVGALQRLLHRLVLDDGYGRTELLLSDDLHVIDDIGEDGERIEEARALGALAAGDDARPAAARFIDVAGHFVELHPVGEWTDEVLRGETVTNRYTRDVLGELFYEFLVLIFVHVQALEGRTGLSGVEEAATEKLLEQRINVRARQFRACIVPPELERHALEALSGTAHDLLAGGHRA